MGRELRGGLGLAWSALALLAVARAALAFVPDMWVWGLNHQRFLDPVAGGLTWALAAVSLLPWIARATAPWLERAGDRIAGRGAWTPLACAVLAATLLAVLPDRSWFVGDFLLRQGAARVEQDLHPLFPQALPLDAVLHHTLPHAIHVAGWLDANRTERLLGALEAGLLAWLAAGLMRTLALRGAGATAALAIAVLGGYLGLFTGYGKAFRELVLAVFAAALFGIGAIRGGRGLLGLALAVAAGLTLHRSALGLLPACGLVWALRVREWKGASRAARLALIGSVMIVGATCSVMLPRIAETLGRWDRQHFLPETPGLAGMAALLAPARLADAANLVLVLCPLVVLLPVLGVDSFRARRREGLFLLLLALPFAAGLLVLHPAQGMFRDWDDFGAAGAALGLLTAWAVGVALAREPRRRGLAAAVVAAAAASALQWLLLHHDATRAVARVEAFLSEPPARAAREHAAARDYLGVMAMRAERWDRAAEHYRLAVEHSPNPRLLWKWAAAETMAGRLERARAICRRILERSPEHLGAWRGLMATSYRLGDARETQRAATAVLALAPGDPEARYVLETLQR